MTTADDLRRLAEHGAGAIESLPRLEATIAGLEATIADLTERLRACEASHVEEGWHVVAPGQTLWSISRTYGTTVDALKEWNRLDSTIIAVGQRLRVAAPEVVEPSPILWGSSVSRATRETEAQAFERTNAAIGPLQVVRHFIQPGKPLAWPEEYAGVPTHVSWKFLPRDVLAGKHDAEVRAWASQAPDHPTWWSYWHEPEDEIANGVFTAADYRAAWRRLVPIVRDAGRDLRSTLTLMEYTLRPEHSGRTWTDYFPGDEFIDVFAWDAYFSPGRPITDVYRRPREVSAAAGKPWAIAETAVAAGDTQSPEERRRLLTELAASALVGPRPVFVCYFDSTTGGDGTWPISGDPEASAAWKAGRE